MEPRAIVQEYNVVEGATPERVSALSALELSSSSNSGSSSNSSPQRAHTTISISSPNVSDQSLPIQAPASNASVRARPPFLPKVQAMKSLKESIPHAMILQRLIKSENVHQKDESTHKKRVRRLSKEMYMIVSMYALLQGVLFVAVAQSSAFTCKDWWGPAGIAGGVTLGTLWGVVDKLCQMGDQRRRAKRSKRCRNAVYDKIMFLYCCGSGCPIDGNLEPQISRRNGQVSRGLPNLEPKISRALLCPRGLLVLGFLVGFSLLIIASCTCMLCHSNSRS